MVKIIKLESLKEYSTLELQGKILKIGLLKNQVSPNVKLKITNIYDEVIVEDYLNKDKMVFYPRVIIGNSSNFDYHISFGKLFILIDGLASDEVLDYLVIYYE